MMESKVSPNFGKPPQEAACDKLDRLERIRLAHECARLDPECEQEMADEGLKMEKGEWPKY